MLCYKQAAHIVRLVLVDMFIPYIISIAFGWLYVSMQTISPYAGDSGGLVASASTWGIAHPPGYPLFCLFGNIISHALPIYSVSWRVGLLSSLPMACSLFFLWRSIYHITSSKLNATITSVWYGLLYPVWLYAIVPEVFGLFSFFSSFIMYIFLRYQSSKQTRYLFILAGSVGLSLTHHHVIVLLVCAIGLYILLYNKSLVAAIRTHWIPVVLVGCAGLVPYIYAPIVSSFYPFMDWEHPANIHGFIRLVTRASYGTFRASSATGYSLLDRLLNVTTFFQYIWNDFTVIGILFAGIGMYGFWRYKRSLVPFFALLAGLQVFYFFYAGFPVVENFPLGTLERFFIVPYQTIVIVIGMGIYTSFGLIRRYVSTHATSIRFPTWLYIALVSLVVIVLEVRLFRFQYAVLSPLKHDKTVSHLADDILASVPFGGVVNLTNDTSAFAFYYAYGVLQKRQDIIYVSYPLLQHEWYRDVLRHRYPTLHIPISDKPVSYTEYFSSFLALNAPYRAMMDEGVNTIVSEFWVPRGLLRMYYASMVDIPPKEIIIQKNTELWSTFSNPLDGALGIYQHMLLADVSRYYADKRLIFALSLLVAGYNDQAQIELAYIHRLLPKRTDVYTSAISTLLDVSDCTNAYSFFQLYKLDIADMQTVLTLAHRLYTACPEHKATLEAEELQYQQIIEGYGTKIE